MSAIRILVADDHVFYREGVKTMLAASGHGIVVVGEAASGDEAIRQARALSPDVVLMDLKMPGLTGVEATRELAPAFPILVLTMFDDDSVFAAMRAGARGYLLKDATLDDLARAITAVHRGEAIFSPGVAVRLRRYFSGSDAAVPFPFPDLTERERDVLAELVRGRSNAEVAARLHLTPKTVRNYVSAILTKLQARDRAQAIVKARDAGFTG